MVIAHAKVGQHTAAQIAYKRLGRELVPQSGQDRVIGLQRLGGFGHGQTVSGFADCDVKTRPRGGKVFVRQNPRDQ